MAKIKPRNAFSKYTVNGFGGIGSASPLSGAGAVDVVNFRIRPDGTLAPREGTRILWSFDGSGEIRGFWDGSVQSQSLTVAAVGNRVYRLDSSAQRKTPCGTLNHTAGRVRFALFRDVLYLLDGDTILYWNASAQHFEAIIPYAPLYGYMWDPHKMGTVNEPLNLLSPHIRIHYLNTTGSTSFYLPFTPTQIDSIRSPTKRLEEYTFSADSNVVTVPEAASCAEVIISMAVNIDTSVEEKILHAKSAHVYTKEGCETLLLYGSDGDWRTYCSAPVSDSDLNVCRAYYPGALPVYFRGNDVLFLGDSEHPVTAITPHFDCLLAFNNTQTWLLQPGTERIIDAYALINDTGAVSSDAVTLCGETPATVTDSGVYLIQSSTTRPEILTYKCISTPVWDMLSPATRRAPILYRSIRDDELWLSNAADEDGVIWVYSLQKKEWYRFTGLSISFFAECSEGTVFASGNRLVLFDKSHSTDCGNAFQCAYVSNYCDFGRPESTRRSLRANVCASLDGGVAELTVTTERGSKHFSLVGKQQEAPESFDLRIPMGRHRFLQFAIELPASRGSALYKAGFYANC